MEVLRIPKLLMLMAHCVLYLQDNPCDFSSLPDLELILSATAFELEQSLNRLIDAKMVELQNIGGVPAYRYVRPSDISLLGDTIAYEKRGAGE